MNFRTILGYVLAILAMIFAIFNPNEKVVTQTETVVQYDTIYNYLPPDTIQKPIYTIRERLDTVLISDTVVQAQLVYDTVYMDTCHVYSYKDSSNTWVNLQADFDLCTKDAHFIYTSKFVLPHQPLFHVGAGYLIERKDPFIYGRVNLLGWEAGVIKGVHNSGVYIGKGF